MRLSGPTIGRRSAYTVLGFAGYGLGALVAGVLGWAVGLSLAERVIVLLAPPLAFLAVVAVATARAGYERIVFYQTAITGVAATGLVGLAIGGRAASMTDVATIGIGAFLVLGRIGCWKVGCCHGRPARIGVRYGHEHARLGFPSRWVGRRVAPVQLVESAVSAATTGVAIAIALTGAPGDAAALYASVYGVTRFGLEVWRGDRDRGYWRGLSEGQRLALASVAAAVVLRPSIVTGISAALLAIGAAAVIATARRPAIVLRRPRHLDELEAIIRDSSAREPRKTSAGLAVSCVTLPDGRKDFVWSRADLNAATARRVAADLFGEREGEVQVIAGRHPGLVHVIVA